MLILIAGITGNIGHYAARHAFELGHEVRGLSRSPDKLDPLFSTDANRLSAAQPTMTSRLSTAPALALMRSSAPIPELQSCISTVNYSYSGLPNEQA